MEYYLLTQSEQVKTPISLLSFTGETFLKEYDDTQFESLDILQIANFEMNDWLEIPDILTNPTMLISDKLKNIFELYDTNIEYRGIQLFPKTPETSVSPLFWIPKVKEISCLHTETQFYPNKWLKNLVIDQRKTEKHSIIKVADIIETRIIVSLRVAESILRRQLYGVSLTKVEVI